MCHLVKCCAGGNQLVPPFQQQILDAKIFEERENEERSEKEEREEAKEEEREVKRCEGSQREAGVAKRCESEISVD